MKIVCFSDESWKLRCELVLIIFFSPPQEQNEVSIRTFYWNRITIRASNS